MITDAGQRIDRHGEDRARAAVLEMTRTVLGEVGYQRLRVETVAARAGVPRVWLRRWWTTRPLLVAEALQRMSPPPDVAPTGDVRADLRAVVRRTATFLAHPVVGDALAGLTADAASDPVAAERLAALHAARRAGDVAVLLSAVARGDLRPDTDVGLVLDVVYGTLLARAAAGVPPTSALVEALVTLLLEGQGVPQAPTTDGHALAAHAFGWTTADGDGADGNGFGGNGVGGNGLAENGFGGNGFGENGLDEEPDGLREPVARPDADRDGALLDAGPARNGAALNGSAENGLALNGSAQNGAALNGSAENGSAHDGSAHDGAAHDGSGRDRAGWREPGGAHDAGLRPGVG